MATASEGESFRTAVVLANKNTLGVVTPQGLERPLASLAENVQRSMGAFYSVHKALMVTNRTPTKGLEQFKQTKREFRTECESLRQVLQTAYRHAVDFATSCQRAPNDRFISAKRCQVSGKSVLRDIQGANSAYDRSLESFRAQESILNSYLTDKNKKGGRPLSENMGRGALEHPEAVVSALFAALEDLQSSLRDILAFWEGHTSFLALVVNRQSNFPSPGDETKATVELWVRYQAALLQTSSSISQSADAMSVDPSITTMHPKVRRRVTYPSAASEMRTDSSLPPKNDVHESNNKHKPDAKRPSFRCFIKRIFGRK